MSTRSILCSGTIGIYRPPAEEAQNSVSGMGENAIHAKYIELVRISTAHCVTGPPP